MKYNPQPHQEELYTWLRKVKRSALFSFMGSGKTVATLTALKDENAFPALIIAPLRVAKNTWPAEVTKWDHLKHLKVSVLAGTPTERERALKLNAEVYTVNYENLPWLVETLGKKWPFRTVVADECTRLKGFRTRQGTKRAKALARVAHTLVDRMILLTGTPTPNGLLDLWGQMWFIDKGERLGASYTTFLDRWFTSDYLGYNWTPIQAAQGEIQNLLTDICLTVRSELYGALDKPIVTKIPIKLGKKATKAYKEMEKAMFTELEATEVEVFSAAAKTTKCRQIAAGFLYSENGSEELDNEKLLALESVVEEANGAPIIVAYHFKTDLERLKKHFKQGVVFDDKKETQDDWNAGKIPLLFLHPASAGMGLNLQDGGNIMVFYTCDWSMENHVQVIERIGPARQKAAGHNRPVFLYYLLAEDTVDELIYERLESKKDVQEILLKALSRYKEGK